ncbi:hypothetical protein O6H91_06G134000 [Diphasiastrum complanatum]|uniref:Uncharacterized protein n=1 Tax=Diphasiastrum complanatum TaxID=34168 RepID=A0ACC2DJ07_DIPCM|nr:hypothetical protein O6H91_06G134000 [Diphasiastrum complanatum]
MASYALEDFVGNGALKGIIDRLTADGWDDVPTLKMMNAEDMDTVELTQQQRDAIEIRTYLHDRSLMEYADTLEASGKSLPELLNTSPTVLTSQYGMKRGHVVRFIDRASACGVVLPVNHSLPARKKKTAARKDAGSEHSYPSRPQTEGSTSPPLSRLVPPQQNMSPTRMSEASYESSAYNSTPGDAFETYSSVSEAVDRKERRLQGEAPSGKGIVAADPSSPRFCGLIQPPGVTNDVTPLEVLEKIFIQRITPEYKNGVDPWALGDLKIPPPSKAADLWTRGPAILFCLRRPGCVMCRAEAHQLYARKALFDSMGIQLIAVLNEFIEAEVRAFWPRYWGGAVVVDKNRDFFRALGGGRLMKESFFTGFVLNARAVANHKRARAVPGIENNFNGEGTIKGGLYIMRPGKGGAAYMFIERNFGDWAPLEEVLEVCNKIQVI